MKKIRSKSSLYDYLIFIPTNEVRTEINKIIAKCRQIPLNEAKYKKLIRPNELEKILLFFGIEKESMEEAEQNK